MSSTFIAPHDDKLLNGCLPKTYKVIDRINQQFPNDTLLKMSVMQAVVDSIATENGAVRLEYALDLILRDGQGIRDVIQEYPDIFPQVTLVGTPNANGNVTIVRRNRNRHVKGGKDQDQYGASLTVDLKGSDVLPQGDFSVRIEETDGEDVIDEHSNRHFGLTAKIVRS